MSDISLTASMRSNLLSLQNTQSLMDITQERLSTGKKVNSALDNPSSFYTAQSLTNRASDLSSLLDSMGQGISTIKAADEAITSITEFVDQAKAIANQARDEADKSSLTVTPSQVVAETNANAKLTIAGVTVDVNLANTDNDVEKVAAKIQAAITGKAELKGKYTATGSNTDGTITIEMVAGSGAKEGTVSFEGAGVKISGELEDNRGDYVKRYNDILTQIDQLAKDAGYKGVNLLGGEDQSLTVVFNEDRSSSLTIQGVDGSAKGLGLVAETDWSTNAAIDAALDKVSAATNKLRSMSSEFGNTNKLRSMSSEFGNNYSVVQTREEFTENLINVLEEGSDKLTLADMNEESANMLALQTRQQLAINSLSLASQAAQSVLSLF